MINFTGNKILSVLFCLCSLCFALNAQQRTGNIVEYFGKEKVNEIEEGKLLHVFKTGLTLKLQNSGVNSSTFPEDPVFNTFLMNPEYRASKNKVFDVDFKGEELKWTPIKVDSTSSFRNRNLRSSYVYLTYTSNSEKVVLFEASGHTLALINGYPHEGDYYDYGWSLVPIKLKKGTNIFVLKVGRFPRIRARLIEPKTHVQITTRDLTLPDVLIEEPKDYLAAVRVVNATENWVKGYEITSEIDGKSRTHQIQDLPPLSVQKVAYKIAHVADSSKLGRIEMTLNLSDGQHIVDTKTTTNIRVKSKYKKHKRTFISAIDGSVQYYSIAPSTTKDTDSLAMFLSVHGASVKAENQANAYKQKDWGHVIAPTNRRPFGFAWEDWGRLDALEVLAEAKHVYKPAENRIYLTGHSMGGHGTWYLGATYPDKFAALAPCAGYPDLLLYRDRSLSRFSQMSEERMKRFGITPKILERMKIKHVPSAVENMITRAGTPSRTLELIRNYLHHGIYIYHGEKDNVVPTAIARDMRERLGKFHPDFTYYEYPDGTHWYGDHSMDWEPIFDMFKNRSITEDKDIDELEFYTGSPGVSSKSHFISIYQQEDAFKVSSFKFLKDKDYTITTNNVDVLKVEFSKLKDTINSLVLDGKTIKIDSKSTMFFKKENGEWQLASKPDLKQKGPHRNGGFKDAFTNNVVLVYATKGNEAENKWYYNRALFDAEKFWYRANGNIEMIPDTEFSLKKYADRNVVLYGNKDNNSAWTKLLKESPIQVMNNAIDFDGRTITGSNWGMYFIVPRTDSNKASVGVVTATGEKGMKAAYANHYLVNGTTFPDVVLFEDAVLEDGVSKVKCAGFFGNDWSVKHGDFEWK
ncbi:prolyl oligopeptidase family protein [Jejuia pallidilutea]|uniref:Prolyl oligopeptidase family protein n=2 Tax=Jejuia pallidilutea TaxID=504487 RepID=A0A362X116_9FLAO|nr:prolyl oligopeptidase family serine peptidase [Jejuia pallidilutea]PQV48439.1 prolyl oligopeptidase family protein [Jejuia pallidilutea]